MKTRGARIERARLQLGKTQQALSLATGVGQRTIGRIEAGERENTTDLKALENIEKLEAYLGIADDPLAGDDDAAVNEPTDVRPPVGGLSQVPLTALLAEALSRVAQFEAQTGVHIEGREPPRRVRWATEDAPPTRRDPGHPDRGVSGAK